MEFYEKLRKHYIICSVCVNDRSMTKLKKIYIIQIDIYVRMIFYIKLKCIHLIYEILNKNN